ncbi:MAG: hypothetical protein J5794_00615 [Lachnospiraceae bacterium]|nr:hypothetical protein [Lachnospiraceae bacterium]
MKRMIKILALLLAVVLAVSFCACQNTNTPETKSETKSGQPTTAPTKAPTQPASTKAPGEKPYTVKPLKEAAVGDVVVFGTYEMDGDTANGNEPIEWLVLDKNSDSLLVISLYALASGVYTEGEDTDVSWETSSVRTWLNGEFFNAAFSTEEQAVVKTTTVAAEKNPRYEKLSAGNDTQDKLFFLSLQEAEQYFTNNASRACSPTKAVLAEGGFSLSVKPWYSDLNYACMWWLRNPGMDTTKAAYVDKSGSFNYNGNRANYNSKISYRPAMWLSVN